MVPSEATEPPSSRAWKRIVGSLVGLALLAAAIVFALRRGVDPTQVLRSLRAAPAWLVVLAVLLPAANWILISLSFWIPMRRLGRIAPTEMLAVIGAAWLLNYLPLRPGLFGRIAYHKTANSIAVRDSVTVTLIGMALGGVAVLATVGISAILPPSSPLTHWLIALSLPPLLASALGAALRRAGLAWIPMTFLARYADLLVWVARYAVIFRLSGMPIGLPQAVAFAAVSQLSIIIPFVGNGLGLREWGIGLVAANWPFPTAAGIKMPAAMAADLLNRAAEVAVAIPAGVAGVLWLLNHKGRESKS